MSKIAEYLIETADRCIRLAREKREAADSLEAIGNDLLAKAVEIDATRQKDNAEVASAAKS
jgi:hypothetical protein